VSAAAPALGFRGPTGVLVGLLLACRPAATPPAATPPAATHPAETARESFVQARLAHPTVLNSKAPSPERLGVPTTPEGARAVRYGGATGPLLAWFATPPGPGPHPLLVYLHGGFALAPSDFEAVRPVLDAGFAVMTPSWRGENGNPGALELLFGELDDAAAAIAWACAQPEVDARRVHVLGHSVGGGLAALLSLRPDVDVVDTASIGGIYVPETFVRWAKSDGNAKLVRFDPALRSERELRVLGPHVADMVHPHIAYIGRDDTPFLPNAKAVREAAARVGAPFVVETVDGDHERSRGTGIAAWLAAHGVTR
jgi:acetyl esterase/lipase